MRSLVLYSLMLAMLWCLVPAIGLGQSCPLPRETHPWGRFEPGAWKRVRVLTETFDEQGNVTGTSITETKTTLQEVSSDAAKLAMEVFVEIAGKRLDTEPQAVEQGLHGEPHDKKAEVKSLADSAVTIEGRPINCRVEQVEFSDANTKTTIRTFWSPVVPPYILKQQSTIADLKGNVQTQLASEVIALDMPRKVLGEILSTSHVKTVVTHANGTTSTLSVTSIDVPGGVICQTTKEIDENGRLVCRRTLNLIDYGLEPLNQRWGLLQRLRGHRVSHTYHNASE